MGKKVNWGLKKEGTFDKRSIMAMNKEVDGIKIERELITNDGYRWLIFNKRVTGLTLVCLEDMETGIVITTPLSDRQKRIAAWKAWAGARQSRSPEFPWKIMSNLVANDTDTDAKVTKMFATYGHASVGDMARLTFDIVGAPMHVFFKLFNLSSTNSGQEKSTRFQRGFGKSSLPDLKLFLPKSIQIEKTGLDRLQSLYAEVGDFSLKLFNKWKEKLEPVYRDFFKPEGENVDHAKALEARVLDTARKFLLLGFASGMNFEDSARDISRIIGILKASDIYLYQKVASQLERLFAPSPEEEKSLKFLAEAPSLIRHTEPNRLVDENLTTLDHFLKTKTNLLTKVPARELKVAAVDPKVTYIGNEYTAPEKMLMQYIWSLYPELVPQEILKWIKSVGDNQLIEIGKIIGQGHDNYQMMDHRAETTGMTVGLEAGIAVIRDLNRHRAYGRFIPLLDSHRGILDILGSGFVLPAYLTGISEFTSLAKEYESDMILLIGKISRYIGELFETYEGKTDLTSVINLLPLGLKIDMFMHGDPKQLGYMSNQRNRPGGDIDYTTLAWELNRITTNSEPLLSAIAISTISNLSGQGIDLSQRPDPGDRARFFNRG